MSLSEYEADYRDLHNDEIEEDNMEKDFPDWADKQIDYLSTACNLLEEAKKLILKVSTGEEDDNQVVVKIEEFLKSVKL